TGVQAPADTVAPTLREISEQAKTPPPRRAPVPTAIVTPEAIQAQPAAPPPPRRDAAPSTKRAMQTGAQRELEGAAARSEHTNAAGATRPPTVAQRLAAIERLIEAGDIPQARVRLAALAKQFPLLDLTEWQLLLGPSR
ncbi:MAG: hypothetical protein K0U93_30435, partial [Gammaproteobacteria bacterium]|nr:hypothetical protein [Gammaproteobacteria bacterium]